MAIAVSKGSGGTPAKPVLAYNRDVPSMTFSKDSYANCLPFPGGGASYKPDVDTHSMATVNNRIDFKEDGLYEFLVQFECNAPIGKSIRLETNLRNAAGSAYAGSVQNYTGLASSGTGKQTSFSFVFRNKIIAGDYCNSLNLVINDAADATSYQAPKIYVTVKKL